MSDVVVITELGRGDNITRPNVRRYPSIQAARQGVAAGEVPGANLVRLPDGTEIRGTEAVRQWVAA